MPVGDACVPLVANGKTLNRVRAVNTPLYLAIANYLTPTGPGNLCKTFCKIFRHAAAGSSRVDA